MNRAVSLAVPRPDPTGKPDVSALQRWVVAICAIRFDLQQGQLVEECYPANALSPEEELDVAFSSFPDSMSQGSTHASVHDCVFFFRIRRRGSVTPDNPEPPRRTVSHPINQYVDVAVDHTARQLKFEELEEPQRSWSETSVVLEESPLDGTGGKWSSLPLPSTLLNAISPKPATKGTSTPSDDPPSGTAVSGEVKTDVPVSSADAVNGSSRGGPGSGGPRYLYGFVFNRQRQDERLRRGGEQKSVVILSERPYSCVFKPLVQIAGPMYFDIGARALEQVATYVSHWAPPVHGQLMELVVGSVSIRAHLPPAHTLPPGCGTPMDDFTSAMAPVPPLNRSIPQGVFHDVDLFGSFRGVLMNLWVLWELLLVGEPLMVIAPTPSQVCEAVAALVSLVAPLPCNVDFRPYFTIHDPDFSGLNSVKEGEKAPQMVLGVTNLFFLKALKNLPHVISVGTPAAAPSRLKTLSPLTRQNSQPGSNNNNNNNNRRLSLQLQLSPLTRFSPVNLLKVARVRKDGPLSLMSEHRECLWTSYVAATKPDTSVLNRLVDAGVSPRTEESMSMVNNEVLRRHFLELTTNFLAPFGPYLRATTPQEGASPFRDPPPLPPFHAHDFLEALAARGAGKFLSKRLRANWLDLYRRFLEGPNFMPWFQRRRAVAEQEQHRIWRQARSKANVETFLTSMTEVEVLDSFSAVERHLIIELQMLQRAGLGDTETQTVKKLRGDLRTIFNSLPKDVQQMLLTNPQRAGHLQQGAPATREILPKAPPAKSPSRFGLFWPSFEPEKASGASSRQLELLQDPLDLNRT